MPPQLKALTDGPDILLDKPVILVGRHQECDIQISSRKISRKHCCIAQVNGSLLVRDLFSTNGIRVNGQRVQEGYLGTGDELSIASFRYEVRMVPESISHQVVPIADDDNETVRKSENDSGSFENPVPLSDSNEHSIGLRALPANREPHTNGLSHRSRGDASRKDAARNDAAGGDDARGDAGRDDEDHDEDDLESHVGPVFPPMNRSDVNTGSHSGDLPLHT